MSWLERSIFVQLELRARLLTTIYHYRGRMAGADDTLLARDIKAAVSNRGNCDGGDDWPFCAEPGIGRRSLT